MIPYIVGDLRATIIPILGLVIAMYFSIVKKSLIARYFIIITIGYFLFTDFAILVVFILLIIVFIFSKVKPKKLGADTKKVLKNNT